MSLHTEGRYTVGCFARVPGNLGRMINPTGDSPRT